MNTKSTKSDKPAAPSLKQLLKLIRNNEAPRGLKVNKNDVGGYTFSYGPKSAPIAIVASVDDVVSAGLAALGLKLSS